MSFNTKSVYIITAVCLLLTHPLSGQTFEWFREYPLFSSGMGASEVTDVIFDRDCNVYVTGVSSWGSWMKEADSLTTIKYDKDGNVIWCTRYGGLGHASVGMSLCRDNDDNTYVAGFAVNPSNYNVYLVVTKYNNSGQIVWDNKTLIQNARYRGYYTIAYHKWYDEEMIFVATMKGDDAWLVQFDASSGDFLWENIYDYQGLWNWWTDLVVESNEFHVYFYVTGCTKFPVTESHTVTAKYIDWSFFPSNMHAYVYDSKGMGLDKDNEGNIYVTGSSHKGTYAPHPMILKYNSDIDLQWDYDFDTEGYSASSVDIEVYGPTGDAYVTGYAYRGASPSYKKNALTFGVNSDGSLLWFEEYGDELTKEEGFEIAVTPKCVYMCGMEENVVGSNADMLTICWNRINGTMLWAENYDSGLTEWAFTIAVQPSPITRNLVYIASGGWKSYGLTGRMATLMYSYLEPRSGLDDDDKSGSQEQSTLYAGPLKFESVYPNPTTGKLNIHFMSPTENQATVSLYDVTGCLVDELFSGRPKNGVNRIAYNGGNLVSGIYFLRMDTDDGLITEKIIIQR